LDDHFASDCHSTERFDERRRLTQAEADEELSLATIVGMARVQQIIRNLGEIDNRAAGVRELHRPKVYPRCIATILTVLPSMIALNRCAQRSSACLF